ncbi:hypothetical protein ACVIW2_004338 [Bradyrhizobium huanghuaihaiense]
MFEVSLGMYNAREDIDVIVRAPYQGATMLV